MKKSLEAELMNLAKKILHMENRADVHELKSVTADLYEKLSVLSFAEKHFEGSQPPIKMKHVEDALAERMEKSRERTGLHNEKDDSYYAPDGTQYNPEGITEPNTEKIKDIVAQMPPESEEIDEVLEDLIPEEVDEDDLRNIGVHYDDLPQFEPVERAPKKEGNQENGADMPFHEKFVQKDEHAPKPVSEAGREPKKTPNSSLFQPKESIRNNQTHQKQSLNDRLKKGISFGLNERVVYVKHLFDGSVSDYDRVLSQLNTFHSYENAKKFIETVVKPDYNHWEGEEQYEHRFLAAIENKLN